MKNLITKVIVNSPFQDGFLPFQKPIYDICISLGFRCNEHLRFPRWLHYIIFNYPVNFQIKRFQKNEARLHFVSGTHPRPMIFPYAYRYELIPIIWDCWPDFIPRMEGIFRRCNIKIAFFTSQEVANHFAKEFIDKHIYYLPEAINLSKYKKGGPLNSRSIDVLEYGRPNGLVHEEILKVKNISHIYSENGTLLFKSFDELTSAIADSKIAICYPRSVTHPEIAKGIETTTQRYWECMYSGTIMIGKAPKELINQLGYNPVVEADIQNISHIVKMVLANLSDYQSLSDRNMIAAEEKGDWKVRLLEVESILNKNDYSIR